MSKTKIIEMAHEADPAEKILTAAGDLSGFTVFPTQVLIGVYERGAEQKTKGGLILPGSVTDEDQYQSKVGLVLKVGDAAFTDGDYNFYRFTVNVGDWIWYKPSDGTKLTIGKQLCRQLHGTVIRGKIPGPDSVY
jgi:co-chaperonin GroES (HSP10)